MTDLPEMLERGATPPSDPGATTPADDVRRGRVALRRQRRLRAAAGIAGVAAVAVLGVTVGQTVDLGGDGEGTGTDPGPAAPGVAASETPAPTRAPSVPPTVVPTDAPTVDLNGDPADPEPSGPRRYEARTVDGRVVVGPYSYAETPRGWEVQGGTQFGVTIAEVGDPDTSPDSFLGKLVITFDTLGLGGGRTVTFEGRDYKVRGDSEHTTVSTPTRPSEPEGVVRIQFPDAGFSQEEMVRFLSQVTVGEGADAVSG
ncbi:hypothetical protein GCM10023340_18520 [Nocardioides marinquilinus]|uniref:Uncharacterized protein n=1 Tax=Nocardioides marinquilinus TaxID=1210400 RepID=A0ABP9PHZ1_9ACTN